MENENCPKKNKEIEKEMKGEVKCEGCSTEDKKIFFEQEPGFPGTMWWCPRCNTRLDSDEMDEELKKIEELKKLNSNNSAWGKFVMGR